MAIEVAPRRAKDGKLKNYILYISLGLLIISLLVYAFLWYSTRKTNKELETLKQKLQKTKRKSLQKNLKSKEEKINTFAELLNSHRSSLNFFSFFESVSHPDIKFNSLSLNAEKKTATISGTTDTFTELGEQIGIFRRKGKIKSITLSTIKIQEEGKIGFKLTLSLQDSLFNYPPSQ